MTALGTSAQAPVSTLGGVRLLAAMATAVISATVVLMSATAPETRAATPRYCGGVAGDTIMVTGIGNVSCARARSLAAATARRGSGRRSGWRCRRYSVRSGRCTRGSARVNWEQMAYL